ncbi:hypothetical protein RB614_09115 [Phytohabitans sp. ZYX-F-186]|uniref:Sulfite exporter TauE/SafE family protein n=1 Tax=Phytohabitans maris TaxID=3071409 RepID=A0ABU0ZC79_9ACTN|nr:hypothetical protein [Phytohabitans sp. ZYX-F-186]MDQ7904679.1 hypothetical protein [Phytohabitans sp. ZYX-F-186]
MDSAVLVLMLIVVVIGGVGFIGGTMAGALLVGPGETTAVLVVPTTAWFALFAVLTPFSWQVVRTV